MKQKENRCKICDDKFYPSNDRQVVCGWKCAIQHANIQTKKDVIKKQKADKKELKQRKQELITPTEWANKLQKYFNKYIRIRDHLHGCISCGVSLEGKKYDAGHFWDKKNYPFLRFHESNCFGQCVQCNKHRGSNAHEYRLRITERITPDQLQWLDDHRADDMNLSVDEIKQKIEFYKQKIKDIQK